MVKKISVAMPVLRLVLIAAFVASVASVASVSNISGVSANDHSQLIADIYEWRDAPWTEGKPDSLPHIYRWNRVLLALGEDVDVDDRMYSTEAQVYVNSGWTRWVRVLNALRQVERADGVTPPTYDSCVIRVAGGVRQTTSTSSDPDNPAPPHEMLLQWSVAGPGCEAGTTRSLEERVSGDWVEVFPNLAESKPLGESDTYREGEYKAGVLASGIRDREFRLVASDGRISNITVVDASGFAPLNIHA